MDEKNLTKSKFLHDILLSIRLNTAVKETLDLDMRTKEAVLKLIFVGTENLNKLYVFAVGTLEILYEGNSVLLDIKARPIWENIKILDDNFEDVVTDLLIILSILRKLENLQYEYLKKLKPL